MLISCLPDACEHVTMARLGTLALNWLSPYDVGGDADTGRIVRYMMHAYDKSLKALWSNGVQAIHRALVQNPLLHSLQPATE